MVFSLTTAVLSAKGPDEPLVGQGLLGHQTGLPLVQPLQELLPYDDTAVLSDLGVLIFNSPA